MNWWIWGTALLVWVAFRAWYDNWRGPVTKAEVDAYFRAIAGTPTAEHNDVDAMRRFLEKDDGREFVMVNLVKVNPGQVRHPETGEMVPGPSMMQAYAKAFLPHLFRRAGHPAVVSRKIGPYIDAWNTAPDPGWTVLGYTRYRSRRDLMALSEHPVFLAMHPFKIAGLAETYSFPSSPMTLTYVTPRVWVTLLILVIAEAAQIGALLLR